MRAKDGKFVMISKADQSVMYALFHKSVKSVKYVMPVRSIFSSGLSGTSG